MSYKFFAVLLMFSNLSFSQTQDSETTKIIKQNINYYESLKNDFQTLSSTKFVLNERERKMLMTALTNKTKNIIKKQTDNIPSSLNYVIPDFDSELNVILTQIENNNFSGAASSAQIQFETFLSPFKSFYGIN